MNTFWSTLLLGLLSALYASLTLASIDAISAAQDFSDTTDPYEFSVSYSVSTTYSGRVQGLILEYDDGNGYQQLGSCIEGSSSALANGNTSSSKSATITMADLSANGLSAGSYDLKLTVYTQRGNTSGGGCEGAFDPNVGTISNFTIVGSSTIDHYAISFDGGATTGDASGPTCTAIEVTVTAHDSSHAAVIANTTVTLSTSGGNGTWVSNSDASTIDLAFGGATSVSTYLRHVIAGATTINVTDGSVTEGASEDPTYTFTAAPLDLVFFLDADADGAPDGSGDDISTLTAGTALSQVLVGIVDSGAACTQDASIAGQTISTNLAYECVNPGTCQRDKDVTASTTAIEDNNSGASIIYQAVSLTYNASGYAPFSLSYGDAGSLKLHGSVVVPASGNNPAATVTGTSNTFVSKPADLTVTVSGNPGTTSSGSGFASAGSDFTVNIQASNSAGGTTPNFGLEAPAETATVGVASLVYPTMTNAGTLTTGSYSPSGSSDGAGSLTASFSEVGSITLQASIGDGDYLGAGNVTGTASGTVGRFYPDHFSLSSDAVLDACTASTNFTYFGQNALNIDYTLTAKNASGATVTHYDAAAGYDVATISPAAEATSNNGTDLSSRLTTSSSTWSSGVYTVDDNTAVFSRSSPEAELDVYLGLALNDALDSRNFDSLDFNPATSGDCSSVGNCTSRLLTGSAKFRWGRLNLSSASGPENQSLKIPFVAEYFDGSRYLTNSYDGCTEIARNRISFNGATIDNSANLTIDVGSGMDNSAGDSINRTLNGNDMILSSGDGNLYFSAPSPTATGTFTVSADIDSSVGDGAERSWLLFDWDLDGNHDDSPPTVTGSFGTYGGHDKVLFRRLVTN
jgi:MSHA biogenesis protein MshQ